MAGSTGCCLNQLFQGGIGIMKRFIVSSLVIIVLFAMSASGSWMWRHMKAASPEQAEDAEKTPGPTTAGHVPLAASSVALETPAPKVAVRAPYMPGTEDAVQLASSLRDRMTSLREREAQATTRQKQVELIYKDIRGERAAVDELRKQVGDELKAVEAQTAKLEQRFTELEQQRQATSQQVSDLEKRQVNLEGTEKKNVEKMGDIYNSMAPESAAKILVQLANGGNMETAVKLLGVMKERQAAKVLAELPEPMAAQMLEKLKGLKRTASPAPPK
jgi:flagellar motility protein MotE (MotC chaperone)